MWSEERPLTEGSTVITWRITTVSNKATNRQALDGCQARETRLSQVLGYCDWLVHGAVSTNNS